PPPAQYLVHKSLAASHVAASYWTTASDVAATSAPVNAASHLSTAVDHGGDRRSTVAVNAAGHRSTAADHGGDRRLTVVGGLVKVGSGPGLNQVWIGSRSGPGRV
nr:hypothetical protein [Tanacetum cinerariifolium]